MKKHCISIVILSVVLLLTNCTSYRVSVSSIAQRGVNGQKVYVAPRDSVISENDLQFLEFAKDLKLAISRKGGIIVTDPYEADQIVLLQYEMSGPQKTSKRVAEWGPTSVRSSSSSMVFNDRSAQGTTYYNYNYGIVGESTIERTEYTRYITIVALENEALKKKIAVQLWQTTVYSRGSSRDMREVFPVLMVAAEKYIGKTTKQAVTLEIYEDDSRIEAYRDN